MKQVTTQNRFELHDDFLIFLENHLEDSKISSFVETLSAIDGFEKYINKWMKESEANEESEKEIEQKLMTCHNLFPLLFYVI